MSHYRQDQRIVGWGPTVQEINHLAQVFEEIRHIACLHLGHSPSCALPYVSDRVKFIPVPPSGGDRMIEKIKVLLLIPLYIRTVLKELSKVDIIHVRCPANISLIVLVMISMLPYRRRLWIKYAGNWDPKGKAPWASRFQRWWLRRGFHRGVVTVNGTWPHQPKHVYSLMNPCISDEELALAGNLIKGKQFCQPIRFIFVGRFDENKGVLRVLKIFEHVRKMGIICSLDLVGDGPEREKVQALAKRENLTNLIKFHGWLPRPSLPSIYAPCHIILCPSLTEGWPKVLGEAMAYGVVPIAGNSGSIPQYLERFRIGKAIKADDIEAYVAAVSHYASNPEMWLKESANGIKAATHFSYKNYLKNIRSILAIHP